MTRLRLKKIEKPSTERRPSKTVDEYICINGKKLSEQTIYDYAQFIPKWEDRIPLDKNDDVNTAEAFLVPCVFPENHINGDDPNRSSMIWNAKKNRREEKFGTPSMMISKGHTKNVVISCRLKHACPDHKILEYFLQRLTGEVDAPRSKVEKPSRYKIDKDGYVNFRTGKGTPFQIHSSKLKGIL